MTFYFRLGRDESKPSVFDAKLDSQLHVELDAIHSSCDSTSLSSSKYSILELLILLSHTLKALIPRNTKLITEHSLLRCQTRIDLSQLLSFSNLLMSYVINFTYCIYQCCSSLYSSSVSCFLVRREHLNGDGRQDLLLGGGRSSLGCHCVFRKSKCGFGDVWHNRGRFCTMQEAKFLCIA